MILSHRNKSSRVTNIFDICTRPSSPLSNAPNSTSLTPLWAELAHLVMLFLGHLVGIASILGQLKNKLHKNKKLLPIIMVQERWSGSCSLVERKLNTKLLVHVEIFEIFVQVSNSFDITCIEHTSVCE